MTLQTDDRTPAASAGRLDHRLNRPQKLVPAVVEALVDRITSGEFPAGSLLPKESDLCEQYGVSRTVAREALRVLEEKGLIKIHQGRGTIVTSIESWNLLDPLVIAAQVRFDRTLDTLDQLVTVRAAMEAELARIATQRMTDEFKDDLTEALGRLADSVTVGSSFVTYDHEFHDIILRASGNLFGTRIVHKVHEWAVINATVTDPERLRSSLDEHRRIHDVILSGDADGAYAAMRQHILTSWEKTRSTIPVERV
ncbi:FadR/GntR family transcriptional regulator [Leifsonia sp. NPDC058230]|uniref:FadR/GntR family transcriptional regulator n=1 Tax=Leifsonia sp. NPDC058230 TaxID=3346391 RepID=UPI0036DF14E9